MAVSALLFVILMVAGSSSALPPVPPTNDCGSAGYWQVPTPPGSGKLVQVQAIIRHGDRTPWTGDFCWPDDSSVWSCHLTSGEIPMYANGEFGQVVPRLYRKMFSIGNEPLQGNCSVGQLTTIGFVQQLSNGKTVRSAYIKSGFLSDSLNHEEVYVRSDSKYPEINIVVWNHYAACYPDIPRTLQSAQSLLLGMYPPNEDASTEVVWIHTMDLSYEYMTANPTLCPMFGNYSNDFRRSKTWTEHYNATKAVLDDIKTATNFTVDEDDLGHFADCLRTHYCHSLAWPEGMTNNLSNRTWTELAWQFYNSFKYPSVSENARVGIGFLLKELWQNMNAVVSGHTNPKFLLYSGHDTTLIPLLVALQADDGVWPSYASMILLELYKSTSAEGNVNGSGSYFVRVIYNGRVLELPFCGSEKGLCSFEDFSKYIETVVPTDVAKQCYSSVSSKRQKWKWY